MNERCATVRVLCKFGNVYYVTFKIDSRLDAEEQVNSWVNNNLINWQTWEIEAVH